ncbi:MAG TPA: BadF/BadG/BcrA/BcrD ATPase family protein [Candidatus Elarobacter sp.]|nr:BadF/BadG/BcrA/BcrD ATPase family protein [Candidatus Elarobacter sp.]
MICVGVDAGGSSTVAAVSQDGAFVREARGGPANPSVIGVDDAADVIVATVRDALHGLSPGAVYAGVAGTSREGVADGVRELIEIAFRGARVAVGDDAAVALRAAIPHGDGAVLIAGTGSIAYAEHGERSVRAGGLGYLAGDEGSAFWIGMQAVKLYGRVLDGRASRDETTDLVARALDAPDRPRLLTALYASPVKPAAIAALAPSIIAFAGKGNRASTKIVQGAAQELGDLAKAVLRAAELLDASPAIAFAGGLLRENSLLTFLLETRLNGDVPGVTVVKGGDEPARGALRIAEHMAR